MFLESAVPVSYTHLDVYKRQVRHFTDSYSSVRLNRGINLFNNDIGSGRGWVF